MSKYSLKTIGQTAFEQLKKNSEHGAEYWSARDLQELLGYAQWRRFEEAVKRAVESCKQSGNPAGHHFADAGKPITGGKGATQIVNDYHLSRFACYLIAQNGDPRKPEIAEAQKYFAIQARRQEISDEMAADRERLEIRKQTAEEFKALSGAARDAGVQNAMFGVFHDAGYKGLYGGLGKKDIQAKKKIPEKENIMDRMDVTELAANQFRMTQTREKLKAVSGEKNAIDTHRNVGMEVREAIRRIGGAMPENLPSVEHIEQVRKRIETTIPKLELEDAHARGLAKNIENKTKEN